MRNHLTLYRIRESSLSCYFTFPNIAFWHDSYT
nr:MAG TPA_asm: hypothetical protein [Caudoviricetes sp.]